MELCASSYTSSLCFAHHSYLLLLLLLFASSLLCIQAQLNNSEVLVLMSVKESLIDPQNATSGWDSGFTDPCSWHYVTCSAELSVIELDLVRLQLTGTISPQISNLPNLKILSFEGNEITGSIPEELGLLSKLQLLDLAGNRLSGTIPSSLGQLKSLSSLLLNNNSLSGPIPPSLASIHTLSSVDFSNNNLSGPLPDFSTASLRAEGNKYLCEGEASASAGGCMKIGHRQPLLLLNQSSEKEPTSASGDTSKHKHARSAWIVCGVVLAFTILLLLGCTWCYRRIHAYTQRTSNGQQVLDTEMCLGQLMRYSLRELQQATNNFSASNHLGTGGSGNVYKGFLPDGSVVAVKRLRNRQAAAEFKVELEMISLAAHRNLLRLLGYCSSSTDIVLVYPYMRNGSVATCLQEKRPLDWAARKRIALGTARALVYLHEQCDPKIIHGDVKAANILLDDQGEAVVADFGLAKFLDHSVSHVTTAVRGTIGYIAPESLSGQISAKTDVFSYGILLLELILGQTEHGFRRMSGQNLLAWVTRLYQEKRLHELVDEQLRRVGYEAAELEEMVQVALLCTVSHYVERPKMSEVLQMLEGEGLGQRWETLQKAEEDRSKAMAMEQKDRQVLLLPPPPPPPSSSSSYIDLLCDTTQQAVELQLSGPR